MSGHSVRIFLCLLLSFTLVACGGGGGSKTPPDSDKDGRPDAQDAFPNDPKEWLDSDKDGVGDNADAFPADASETLDTDKDGVGNNKDAFPSDASESNDADQDGQGDNADTTPLGKPIPAWPTFQGDAQHSGAVDIQLASANFTSRWYQALAISNLQQGAAGDGRVFINNSGQLYALDARTGAVLWSKSLLTGSFNFNTTNPPAYADGVVYVQTGGHEDAYLYAFNAIDGSQLFRSKLEDQWSNFYAPTIVDGTVYIGGGYYGGLYAIDAKTGAHNWWQTLNQYDQFTPAVSGDYVIAYTGSYSPKLTVASKTTGNVLFEIDDPQFQWGGWDMNLAPVVAGELVLANYQGRLVAFNLSSKQLVWQIDSDFSGQASVSGEEFYILNQGVLELRRLSDGTLVSSISGSRAFINHPLVTNNLVFVSDDLNSYAYQRASGALVWTLQGKTGSLMMAEGALLIVAANGVSSIDLEGDIDSDGLPDWWEKRIGKNVNPGADSDGDGLSGLQEFNATTNPALADSDGDGLKDGEEVNGNQSSALKADSDGDGLSDGLEVKTHNSDPSKADSDGDSLGDAEEVAAGLSPINGADALADSDGDGFSNLHEVRVNTLINNASSRPEIGEWSMQGGNSRRNNYQPLLLNTNQFNQRWSKTSTISLNENAITSGGQLVQRLGNQLHAWDMGTGAESWRTRITANNYSWPVSSGDKIAYLSSTGGNNTELQQLNSATGASQFIAELSNSGYLYSGQPLVSHNKLYLINNSARFAAYSLDSGNLLWTSPQSSDYLGNSPLHLASSDQLIAVEGNKLKVYSAADGSLSSSINLPDNNSAYHLALGSRGNVIAQLNSGQLVSINLADGSSQWRRSDCSSGQMALGNGQVYIASGANLCVIDEQSGALRWQLALSNNWQLSNLLLTASHLFYSDGSNSYAIDLQQRLVSWTLNQGGNQLLMDPNGTLYIHNSLGVTAVDTEGDTDTDGINQWWERRYGGDLLANGDGDGDGLTNLDEYTAQSNPNQADSDGDGLSDGAEVKTHQSSPLQRDSDLDGLHDGAEINSHGTSPILADSDGDALDDGRELALGLNANDTGDASADADSDGFSNRAEAYAGTSPHSAASKPTPGDWSGTQGNAAHNGFVPYQLDATHFSLRWRKDIYQQVKPIALGAGAVYTAYGSSGQNHQLAAVSALDGSYLWRQPLDIDYSYPGPLYMNNKLLLQLPHPARLQAYNSSSGAVLFNSVYASNSYSEKHATLLDNVAYSNLGYSSGLVAKDLTSGADLWTNTSHNGSPYNDLLANGDYVFSLDNNRIHALSRSSGALAFTLEAEGSLGNTVLGSRNNLLAIESGNSGAALVSYDLASRQLNWRRSDSNSLGKPVNGNGRIYLLSGGAVQSLNELSGQLQWSWRPSDNYLSGNILVTFSHVFVSTGDKTYALSATSGELQWSYSAGGQLALGADGALYIQTGTSIIAISLEGDGDSDGLPDWWERHFGLNPASSGDAALDKDGDGLSNLQEFSAHTYADNSDSDSDGVDDAAELNSHQTDPTKSDTDGDDMPDGWELEQGFNPLSRSDRNSDRDGDTISNYFEYQQGTDPDNALSLPALFSPGQFSFEDSQLPAGWTVTDGTTDLSISLGVASQGTKALQARNRAGIRFSGFFAASELSLDVKYGCSGTTNVSVYVDGQLQATSAANDTWSTLSSVIPLGQHEVAIHTDSYNCSVYLDNVVIANAQTVAQLGAVVVSLNYNQVQFHDRSGQLLRQLVSQPPQDSNYAKGLASMDNNQLALVFEGSTTRLGLLDLASFEWRYINLDDSLGGSFYHYKGLVARGNFAYLSTINRATNSGRITRVNLDTGALDYVGDHNYSSLAIDSAGLIHAYADGMIYQYHPTSLALVKQSSSVSAVQIAFDQQDRLIVSTHSEILRYSSQGLVEARISLANIVSGMATGTNGELYTALHSGGLRHYSSSWLPLADTTLSVHALASLPIVDSDDDTMPDWWELAEGLNPNSAADASSDSDADGLNAAQEFAADSDPTLSDSDGDLLSDGDEVNDFGSNPLLQDTDSDGLGDADEVLDHGSSPLLVDTDGDLINDYLEVIQFHTDPADANSKPAPLSNYSESFESGMNGWLKPTSATAGWSAVSDSASHGSGSLRSVDIDDSQNAEVEWAAFFEDSILSFDARVASESCCDRLQVFVDDLLQFETHTEDQWQNFNLEISAGFHKVRFVYRKDSSISRDADAAWIDNIQVH